MIKVSICPSEELLSVAKMWMALQSHLVMNYSALYAPELSIHIPLLPKYKTLHRWASNHVNQDPACNAFPSLSWASFYMCCGDKLSAGI